MHEQRDRGTNAQMRQEASKGQAHKHEEQEKKKAATIACKGINRKIPKARETWKTKSKDEGSNDRMN